MKVEIMALAFNVPLLSAAVYSDYLLQNQRLYAVFKVSAALLVLLLGVMHKSSFRLKPLVLGLYALGDLVILRTLVPAAVIFCLGHLVLILQHKFYRVSLRNALESVLMSAPLPIGLCTLGYSKLPISLAMWLYIWFVALIFVQMRGSPRPRVLKAATFAFYVSDVLLTLRTFLRRYLSERLNLWCRVGVLGTYFFATNLYAIHL